MTTQIPLLPTPVPQSTDPQNFAARADAFLAALPPFAAAANAQAAENNTLNASSVAAAASAKNASDLAVAAIGATKFDAATTYPAGALAWSPANGKVYRRKVAGKAAADPSADAVNWIVLALDSETMAAALQVVLVGLVTSNNASITADDTILQALGKLQAQVTSQSPSAIPDGSFMPQKTRYLKRIGVTGLTTGALFISGKSADPIDCEVVGGDTTSLVIANEGSVSVRRNGAATMRVEVDGTLQTFGLGVRFHGAALSADPKTLDFYEEGLWTPEISGLTNAGEQAYTSHTGEYVRIGNRVYWSFQIVLSAHGMAGDVRVVGLPFVVNSAASTRGASPVYIMGMARNDVSLVGAMHDQSSSRLSLTRWTSGANSMSILQGSDLGQAVTIRSSGSYRVA